MLLKLERKFLPVTIDFRILITLKKNYDIKLFIVSNGIFIVNYETSIVNSGMDGMLTFLEYEG